jgi:hypothetical protein
MTDKATRDALTQKARGILAEVRAIPHGPAFGRRLELSGEGLTPEKIEEILTAQLVDIGERFGAVALERLPPLALEQFAVMAVAKDHDTAGLMLSMFNSFVVAYLTPETSGRAFGLMLELEALRREVGDIRKANSGAAH